MSDHNMFAYARVVALAFFAATSTVSAATTGVPGFLTMAATYAASDTTCQLPLTMTYIQLNACIYNSMYTADASGNLFLTGYTDSTCTTASGSPAAIPSSVIKNCVNGASAYVFTTTAPDTKLNVQPSGTIAATIINYNVGDTTCTSTPSSVSYNTAQTCTSSPAGSVSYQTIVDGANNIYSKSFAGTVTCATNTGLITLTLQAPTKCVPSGSTTSGPASSNQFLGASLPSTWVPTKVQTVYSTSPCSGNPYSTSVFFTTSLPCVPTSCDSSGSTSFKTTCPAASTLATPTFAPTVAPSLAPTVTATSVSNALSTTSGASITASLAAAYPGISVSNAVTTVTTTGVSAVQNMAGVTLTTAQTTAFQTAFTASVATAAGVPASSVVGYTAIQGRRLLAGVNVVYNINTGTTSIPSSSGSSSSSSACFAGSELLTLENGATKAIADVRVGDRVLTVNAKGEQVYSDVVHLPHGQNAVRATFVTLVTAAGRDVKMTANHVLPAGACGAASLPYVSASSVVVGDCVQTVSGRERVVSVSTTEGKGIYTAIAMEELIVVNGVVATPYGGVNPTLANIYYNLHRLAYQVVGAGMLPSSVQGATEGLWRALFRLAGPSTLTV